MSSPPPDPLPSFASTDARLNALIDYRTGYREGFRDGFDQGFGVRDAAGTPSRNGRAQRPDDRRDKEDDRDASSRDSSNDDKTPNDERDANKRNKRDDASERDDKNNGDKKEGKRPLHKRPVVMLVLFVVVVAAIIGGVLFWRHSQQHESTDDAFIDGRASAIAAQVGGRVTKLYVTDNQLVEAGAPLLDIDPRDIEARVAQAKAQVSGAQSQLTQALADVETQRASAAQASASTRQAEVDLANTRRDAERYKRVDPDAVSRTQADTIDANLRTAQARLDAARSNEKAARARIDVSIAQVNAARAQIETAAADLQAAELQLSYVHVVAPVRGRVTQRAVEVGNVINVGQRLLALVQPDLWVTANFKETQLDRVRIGQRVDIKVDAYPDIAFRGHVDSFQQATGAYFSMLPAQNATGNYVKVVQRVPVKIVFDDDRIRDVPIGPGMSVVPNVSVGND